MYFRQEEFSEKEKGVLSLFFTNIEGPVFALVNLPETVKAALFARYSRTNKSLRRLFLDEFYDSSFEAREFVVSEVGMRRSEKLFDRVISEYGDDSVAQLGGVHLACEQVSNALTKVIERSRLMSFLEQSTRYLNFGDRASDGRFRYATPPEITSSTYEKLYKEKMDRLFEGYNAVQGQVLAHLLGRYDDPKEPEVVRSLKAASFDAVRGLLPVGTLSNLGIYGSPQSYEYLIMRLRAHPLEEAKIFAELILSELKKVIPAFLSRLDRSDRGGAWVDYRSKKDRRLGEIVTEIFSEKTFTDELNESYVHLVDFDRDAENKILEAILFDYSGEEHGEVRASVESLLPDERATLFREYVGERENRRHKPGRAFEMANYTFEIVSDYGAFRDLQRHRMLTSQWVGIDPNLGYVMPEVIERSGQVYEYKHAMESMAELYDLVAKNVSKEVAAYVMPMAYRIRYRLHINARELMHLVELRSQPAGHESYRKIAQSMHQLIGNIAGHNLVSEAMSYVDYDDYDLGRLQDEYEKEIRHLKNSN